MTERLKRWLDYGAEFSMAGVGVVLFVGGVGMLFIVPGHTWLEGVENIVWGAVAMMLAHMTRRNRGFRRDADKLSEWQKLHECMTSVVQTHANCPKCHGQLAALVALRCMSCSSAYRVAATSIVVEDEAPGEGATKH